MKLLELKIPPPILALLCALVMWSVSYVPIHFDLIGIGDLIASILLIFSIVIAGMALVAFLRVKTNIHPSLKQASTTLVTSGIYHYSRNPMYLSLLCFLLSVAIYLQSLLSIFICFFFISYINRYQIKPEEKHLEALFPEEFLRYKGKVRRWL